MRNKFEPGMDVEFKNDEELRAVLSQHAYTYYHKREILKLHGQSFTIKQVIPGGYLTLEELPHLPWKVRTTFVVPASSKNNSSIPPLFGSMTYANTNTNV